MNASGEDERTDDFQYRLLITPVGQGGSGGVRYGAAMYFYFRERLPVDMLEIYRRCCNLDDEDPVDLAEFEGVEIPPLLRDKV